MKQYCIRINCFKVQRPAKERPAKKRPAKERPTTVLADALRRIQNLEAQAERFSNAIEELRRHHDMNVDEASVSEQGERAGIDGEELEEALRRISTLEKRYRRIQDSVRSLQEHSGLPEGYYYRLPYRWEGPPPNIFDRIPDQQPIVPTETGPAGMVTWTWRQRPVPVSEDGENDELDDYSVDQTTVGKDILIILIYFLLMIEKRN